MSKRQCKHSEDKCDKKKPMNPKFKCEKCGRIANKKEKLCKGGRLKD